MKSQNNLTVKSYWQSNWRSMKLPVRYFDDYSHHIIAECISRFISSSHQSFLEIGGCPGRWADHFFHAYGMKSDSMDYVEENVNITRKNYSALGIYGDVFLGDITVDNIPIKNQYDVVLSDGVLEHFVDSRNVFKNHLKYVRDGGLLIIGVPNIKKSWFYDPFSKLNQTGYQGYRHVNVNELTDLAKENKMDVKFCGYVGVFHLGLINLSTLGNFFQGVQIILHLISQLFLRMFRIKRESAVFSPYIFLIAQKNEQ